MTDDIANDTRNVFDAIHRKHLKLENTKKRLRNLITPAFLDVDESFFQNKVCGDFGCGSSVHGTTNLLNLGAKYVHAMDVNDSFIKPAQEELSQDASYNNRWQLDLGELSALPYDDQSFDFALCQGVIHHMENDQKGLNEICRVLKPGGIAHIMVAGQGGLVNRFWMETAREEYRTNPTLKNIVDSQQGLELIKNQLGGLISSIQDDGSKTHQDSLNLLKILTSLIDEDLILSLQDSFQAPIYKTYTMEIFEDMLLQAGFSSCRRVYRTPTFNNVRKIFASMYGNPHSDLSKILYGTGTLLLVVEK